ncbi:MAG: hypothetical protein QOF46_96, partial [Paraburkholderia sp.]|nr:hypothetical protein [Paraburkholderia sp.]
AIVAVTLANRLVRHGVILLRRGANVAVVNFDAQVLDVDCWASAVRDFHADKAVA